MGEVHAVTGHVGVSGAWKQLVSGTSVGVGGVWKNLAGLWVGVGGAWKQFYSALLATISVTSGSADDGTFSYSGFDSNVIFSAYGSRTPTTYVDGGGNTRTVTMIASATDGGSEFTWFALSGTGISNDDSTFASITIGATTLLRSSAVYISSQNGSTAWRWASYVAPGGDFDTVVQ